jgi:hemerythrin-like domain-containing protein
MPATSRRQLATFAALAAALPLAACGGDKDEKEVGAVEDLMREHGVLRRALLVYAQTAPLLRQAPDRVDGAALNKTAKLFKDFGEDYHERKLEEAHIFPAIRKTPAGGMVDTLIAQHQRGRDITQYILQATASGRVGSGDAEPLARAFESFALMYENHASREDTIIFPAWKNALSGKQLHEMGEKFEDIEKAQFGGDGYDDAVKQIAAVEQSLGFADLARFTAPPPHQAT